jgi:hypothetical protein
MKINIEKSAGFFVVFWSEKSIFCPLINMFITLLTINIAFTDV